MKKVGGGGGEQTGRKKRLGELKERGETKKYSKHCSCFWVVVQRERGKGKYVRRWIRSFVPLDTVLLNIYMYLIISCSIP
jgi:hypothetical protein